MVLMRVKYLDASENICLSFLSYSSILKSWKWGVGVPVSLSSFTFSHNCPSGNDSSLYYGFWSWGRVAECLQLQVVKVLQTTFLLSGLYCYTVEHLWAVLCIGVLYVNPELKISVFCWFNYTGLCNNRVSPYTLVFQMLYIVSAKLNY